MADLTRGRKKRLAEDLAIVMDALGPEEYAEILRIPRVRELAVKVKVKKKLSDTVTDLLDELDPSQYHAVLETVALRHPWRPKHAGWKNVLDQLLHAAYAFLVLAPVVVWPSYWSAAVTGFLLGAIREAEQFGKVDLKILMFWDRLLDVSAFVVGAVVLYHFFGAGG